MYIILKHLTREQQESYIASQLYNLYLPPDELKEITNKILEEINEK